MPRCLDMGLSSYGQNGWVWYGMVWWEEQLTTIGSFSKYSCTGALYEEVEILDG